MKHGFTSRILKTKYNKSNGFQEVEMLQSKQKLTSLEKVITTLLQPFIYLFFGYSRPFDVDFEKVQRMIISACCKSVLRNLAKALAKKNVWANFAIEHFSTMTMLLLIPTILWFLIENNVTYTLQSRLGSFWLLFLSYH